MIGSVAALTLFVSGALAPPGVPGPEQAVSVHVVQPGDTLSSLARRYGMTVSALAAHNGIHNSDLIFVGQRLRLPGSSNTASSTVQTGALSRAQLDAALAQSPWPQHLRAKVHSIIWCESRNRTAAVGRAGEIGLMQIHPVHRHLHTRYNLRTAAGNLAAGWQVFVQAGHSFRPWSCAR